MALKQLNAEIVAALPSCPNAGSGCFADQPALYERAGNGVPGMAVATARTSGNIMDAAFRAGEAGEPLAEVRYMTTEYEPVGANDRDYTVADAGERSIGSLPGYTAERQEAQCAYLCGSFAATCVIRQVLAGQQAPASA